MLTSRQMRVKLILIQTSQKFILIITWSHPTTITTLLSLSMVAVIIIMEWWVHCIMSYTLEILLQMGSVQYHHLKDMHWIQNSHSLNLAGVILMVFHNTPSTFHWMTVWTSSLSNLKILRFRQQRSLSNQSIRTIMESFVAQPRIERDLLLQQRQISIFSRDLLPILNLILLSLV